VRILTRYVVREHVGPLVFALTALTSLLMLQFLARQLANLAGKGLPWSAIVRFFVLSLPFTVAMTLPMAVLVATLYAFGRMAAEHEITAFKASGIRVRDLMAPVLVAASGLSVAMFGFNDQVLPRANHVLRVLQQDIARTRPTLALQPQILNAVSDQFFIRAARIDAGSNRMTDVVIHDLTRGAERKTIYADSADMSLAPNGKDLQLVLYDGHVQEFSRGDIRRLQRSFFTTQVVRVRGIAQGFEATGSDAYKSEREMTVCEMEARYVEGAAEYGRTRAQYIAAARKAATPGQETIRVPRERPPSQAVARWYCNGLAALFRVRTAEAAEPGRRAGRQDTARPPAVAGAAAVQDTVRPAAPDSGRSGAADSTRGASLGDSLAAAGAIGDSASAPPRLVPPPGITLPAPPEDSTSQFSGAAMALQLQLDLQRDQLDNLAVEIHKKFALSFACLVFVLFGPPIALRVPRGGVGVTLGVSIVVFGLYYVCLMGGETLADRGQLPAWVAMWIANLIFTAVGLVMLARVERQGDTSRGGGLREWWAHRRATRALRAVGAPGGAA
jgi:lipopolysaccharide export system permease protein